MENTREPGPGQPKGLGPLTLAVPEGMPWLAEGVRVLKNGGVRSGDQSLSRLLRVAAALDRNLPFDFGWCGFFVRHCLKTAFPETRIPWVPMRARAWLKYGRPVAPQVGALLVFWLYWPTSPFGHSGFYWAEDDQAFHVLGGNQRNGVRLQRVGRNRLLGARWPIEAVPPPALRRRAEPVEAAPVEWGEAETAEPVGTPAIPRAHRLSRTDHGGGA